MVEDRTNQGTELGTDSEQGNELISSSSSSMPMSVLQCLTIIDYPLLICILSIIVYSSVTCAFHYWYKSYEMILQCWIVTNIMEYNHNNVEHKKNNNEHNDPFFGKFRIA